jgi:hypothetical protein
MGPCIAAKAGRSRPARVISPRSTRARCRPNVRFAPNATWLFGNRISGVYSYRLLPRVIGQRARRTPDIGSCGDAESAAAGRKHPCLALCPWRMFRNFHQEIQSSSRPGLSYRLYPVSRLTLSGGSGLLPLEIVSRSWPMSPRASTQSSCFPAGNESSSLRRSLSHAAFVGR